jgi:trigger factor
MKVNLEKIEKNKAYLNFEIDEGQFEKLWSKHIGKTSSVLPSPVFGGEKLPENLLKCITGRKSFMKMRHSFFCLKLYQKGVEEYKLEPVDQPQFDVQQIEKGKPFMATAEVVVKPEVKIKEYKGLEVEKFVYNVTDDEVEKELSNYTGKKCKACCGRRQSSKKEDIAVIDFKGTGRQ